MNVYAKEPSNSGNAERVAAAVNWSAEKDAVWRRKPRGVVKSRRSAVSLVWTGKSTF